MTYLSSRDIEEYSKRKIISQRRRLKKMKKTYRTGGIEDGIKGNGEVFYNWLNVPEMKEKYDQFISDVDEFNKLTYKKIKITPMSKPKKKHLIKTDKNRKGKFDIKIIYGGDILYISKQQYERQSTANRVRDNFIKAIQDHNIEVEDYIKPKK